MKNAPKTLVEMMTTYADNRVAFDYIRDRRWPDKVTCPRCGSEKVHLIETRMVWRCNGCRKQFSVKVGTIYEDSPIRLGLWIVATWLIVNAKNGISSCELARSLGVCQKTAWFMLHRIRLALRSGSIEKLTGDVEADETGIGGLAKNMHQWVRKQRITGTGFDDKTIVAGVLQRGGEIRLRVLQNTRTKACHALVKFHVVKGSNLYTDGHDGYKGLNGWYTHQIVDHGIEYVRDRVIHTNGLENFWSLLKRTMRGTYVSVEPFHLHRYLDEYAFRFNNRKMDDAARFHAAMSGFTGKRLTYAKLTAQESFERVR